MYQDTSEFASGEDKTADAQSASIESFQPDFRGAVGHGHNHAVSAEETILSPDAALLSNDEGVEKSSHDIEKSLTEDESAAHVG